MISPSDYQTIANTIGDYADSLTKSGTHFGNMLTTLSNIVTDPTDPSANASLQYAIQLGQFYTNTLATKGSPTLNAAVAALQKHTIANYGDLNTFLVNHSITVPASFATLSAAIGYIIDPSNIA